MNGSHGKANVSMAPESWIQMMLEIKNNHPTLWRIVKEKPDISEVLGEVGAYLQLEMSGSYDITKTCDDFWRMLRQKGASIILPISTLSH